MTHAPIVPPLVLFLAKHPLVDKFDLSSLVEVTSGAAPLGKEMEDAVRKRFPKVIMKQGLLAVLIVTTAVVFCSHYFQKISYTLVNFIAQYYTDASHGGKGVLRC